MDGTPLMVYIMSNSVAIFSGVMNKMERWVTTGKWKLNWYDILAIFYLQIFVNFTHIVFAENK